MQTAYLDRNALERLAADFNDLLREYPEWRREMYEEMGRAVLAEVKRGLGNGEAAGWQEAVVGSGGGYAAVRPKKETFARDGGSGEPYAVGYVTNSIENGHKQEKGRYVPALGKKLVADRVAGKGAYLAARQRAEEIAYQAAERFAKKIQAKLQEG